MPPQPLPDLKDPSDRPLDRPAVLAALQARIRRLERSGATAEAAAPVPLCDAIDRHLPGGGLARAGVHEVMATDPGAAAGFCALALARTEGTVLWIAAEPDAWPPGLSRFGLSPARLVLVQARHPVDALWAMEEALRCPGVAGALLVQAEIDTTAARRLQLAAEAGGALGLLLRRDAEADTLRPRGSGQAASVALTRWRVGGLAGTGGSRHALGDPRWQLELLRCRGGRPQSWQTTWQPAAGCLTVEGAEEAEPELRPARRRGGAA
jgi:protein ImuA